MIKENFVKDISTDHFSLTIDSLIHDNDSDSERKRFLITNRKVVKKDNKEITKEKKLLTTTNSSFKLISDRMKKLNLRESPNEQGCFSIIRKTPKMTKVFTISNLQLEIDNQDFSIKKFPKKKSDLDIFKNKIGSFSIYQEKQKPIVTISKNEGSQFIINKTKKPYKISHDISLTLDCTTEDTDSSVIDFKKLIGEKKNLTKKSTKEFNSKDQRMVDEQ